VQSRRLNSTKAAETVVAQFSKQIMDVMARRQESGDTVDLQAIFESFDIDGDGSLSQKELVVGLNEFGIKMSKDERKHLLQMLDEGGDGTIEWREFSAVVQRVQQDAEHELEVRKLRSEKNLIADQLAELESDTAGAAGQLESRKMNSSKAARAVCARFSEQIMQKVKDRQSSGDDIDMKSIFETFDTNGDGIVSRRELKVGLVEFGIVLKKDEAKELMEILDEVRTYCKWYAVHQPPLVFFSSHCSCDVEWERRD
jgi:Ca2+-binding EF-hand superfamily protein